MVTKLKTQDEGKVVAKALFPEIELVPDGHWDDWYKGIDARLGQDEIQIKKDTRIFKSHNIYHEIYEKTDGMEWQEWRSAYGKANLYLFITQDENYYYGFLIKTDDVAKLEIGLPLFPAKTTSLGFLMPMEKVRPHIIEARSKVIRRK